LVTPSCRQYFASAGLRASLSIGIGQSIYSSPEKPGWHRIALRHGLTVTISPTMGNGATLGNGVAVIWNAKTGEIVNVNSMPKADRLVAWRRNAFLRGGRTRVL
jgi:hypothetical protein